MPLETGTYISDLNTANPAHTDGLNQDDSHMRLVKSVLKNTFPNITGAITGTQAQINALTALTFPLATANIADASITTAKLVDANVTTAKLVDASVTAAKLASASVATANILDANVTTAKLVDANVTYAKVQNVTRGAFLGRQSAGAGVIEELSLAFSQCQLTKSGSNLVLIPKNGNRLFINSVNEIIPDAGVTLSPTGTAGVLVYIYAYMSSGTMTLEASTTAYTAQAGTGWQVKTGDVTRTLVGMAVPTAGPAWSAAQFRSYYNDSGVVANGVFTANRTVTSTTYVELHSEIRCTFLCWASEIVSVAVSSAAATDSSRTGPMASIGFDGTSPEDVVTAMWAPNLTPTMIADGVWSVMSLSLHKTGLSEGLHYATLLAKQNGGGGSTGTFVGTGTAGTRTGMSVRVRRF